MNKERAAILIHGLHVDAELDGQGWKSMVWGSEDSKNPTRAGRVVEGIRLARLKDAKKVIFGTGASEKNGLKESDYTYAYLMDNIEPLARLLGLSARSLKSWLIDRVVIDRVTQNTKEEIHKAIKLCLNEKLNTLYLVTSDWHAPRVRANASQILADSAVGRTGAAPDIFVAASLGDAQKARIVERGHRPDRDPERFQNKLFSFIGEFFQKTDEEKRAVLEKVGK